MMVEVGVTKPKHRGKAYHRGRGPPKGTYAVCRPRLHVAGFGDGSPVLEQGQCPCYSKGMAKVTSKLQVTVPKAVADRFGIRPGDDIEWVVDGTSIRVIRAADRRPLSVADRLKVFDEATARQQSRNQMWRRQHRATPGADQRGRARAEVYTRGRPR